MIIAARPSNYRILCHVLWSRGQQEIERCYVLKGLFDGKWSTLLKDTSMEFLGEYLPSYEIPLASVPIKTINHYVR